MSKINKAFTAVITVIFLLTACSSNQVSDKDVLPTLFPEESIGSMESPLQTANDTPSTSVPSIKEISELFDLSKDDVLKRLGDKYEIVPAGAEGAFEGYYFEDKGITVVFDMDTLNWINCKSNVDLNGAQAGMNFSQIQEKLGKAEVQETWFEVPENKAYELIYELHNCDVSFLAFSKEGEDTTVWIYKKGRLDHKKKAD